MYSKDNQDWFDILGGKSVPDANPEIVEDAETWRVALRVHRTRRYLPPLHLPEQKKTEPSIKTEFSMTSWAKWFQPSYAVIVMAVILLPLSYLIYIGLPDNGQQLTSEENQKSPIASYEYGDIIVSNAQQEAIKCFNELQTLGFETTSPTLKNQVWQFEFSLEPLQSQILAKMESSQSQTLAEILRRYDKPLPPHHKTVAILRFKDQDASITP